MRKLMINAVIVALMAMALIAGMSYMLWYLVDVDQRGVMDR